MNFQHGSYPPSSWTVEYHWFNVNGFLVFVCAQATLSLVCFEALIPFQRLALICVCSHQKFLKQQDLLKLNPWEFPRLWRRGWEPSPVFSWRGIVIPVSRRHGTSGAWTVKSTTPVKVWLSMCLRKVEQCTKGSLPTSSLPYKYHVYRGQDPYERE